MKLRNVSIPALLLLVLMARAALEVAAAAGPSADLNRLYEDIWRRWLREDPTLATSVGDREYNDRWPDLSLGALARTAAADRASLAALEAVGASGLSSEDALNREVVALELRRRLSLVPYKPFAYAISQLGGLQNAGSVQSANELADLAPFSTVEDFQNWIARLNAFGRYVDQVTDLLRLGIAEKRTQPRVIVERVEPQLAAQRVAAPDDSPFFAPFKRMPASFSAADKDRLTASARAAIASTVLPAFARFSAFFHDRYLPACRSSIGISDTPQGAAYYRELIAYHTTVPQSAQTIHELGLREVRRIRAEMDRIISQVGFNGSFLDFAHYLRTDPKFFYANGDDLLKGYMVIAKRIDPNLTQLFGKLPRTPYGVKPIPELSAPNVTAAYYQPLAADGSRPGFFYVNLYKPEARPKWEMEVLTSHEAVPGHHLQLALQYENAENVPMIRRTSDFTAYVEGWALYAESLGDDLGLYTDPYAKFGQLTYDMWRAVRLVVDTGIHSQGWTRGQAVEFFTANAPKSELDISNEIDRYIAWPGQALAYKIGQLKIIELRDAARSALGARFDIREFHDVLLSTGAVPLPVMERSMRAWIERKAAGN